MTEVGISLALRRQDKLLHADEGPMKKKEKSVPLPSKKKPKIVEKKASNASWQVFMEGLSLYVLCMVLPGILGAIVRWCKKEWKERMVIHRATAAICSQKWISNLQWCKDAEAAAAAAAAASKMNVSLTAPDTGISDVAIVAVLSLSLALVRVALVHYLVPHYKQPERLEALVRCKSVHLLSSHYSGTVTPRGSMSRQSTMSEEALKLLPPIPLLTTEKIRTNDTLNPPSQSSTYLKPKSNSSHLDDQPSNRAVMPSDDWLILDEDESNRDHGDNQVTDEVPSGLLVSSGLLTVSSAQSLTALLHQAQATTAPPPSPESPERIFESDRLFAAPKYATAVFRLMYCTTCSFIALRYFRDAEFWPPAVGGKGSTKHCWDLSSVGAAVMDSDFDHRNTVLRRYFLVQASYHFHSGAFHVVTSILLWLVSSSSKNKEKSSPKIWGFIPSGMFTFYNFRTFLQHSLAVGLIFVTYIFSSMRRLAAVGMFAFDVSSLFLHLLQLSINAPRGSKRESPRWVWILHRFLVIPSFCYSRFYVFPFVIGYSALVESQDWLGQLEKMSFPGAALHAKLLLSVWLCLLMTMNVVYGRRLLYHHHVTQTVSQGKKSSHKDPSGSSLKRSSNSALKRS